MIILIIILTTFVIETHNSANKRMVMIREERGYEQLRNFDVVAVAVFTVNHRFFGCVFRLFY